MSQFFLYSHDFLGLFINCFIYFLDVLVSQLLNLLFQFLNGIF